MGRVAEETSKGLKWGVIQKCTLQPVQFIYGIILARLISPDEMGILGLTGIFFAIAGQLQNCGFGAALIRKQDRTDEDICTVFWFNITISLAISAILFLAAPWFADFFHQPALLNLTRVSAGLMFLGSTSSVHYTLYNARRDFKTPAIIGMICTLVPMPFTIWAAYSGWSYWSLMVQSVISSLLSLSIIWIISPWKPSFKWSAQSFRDFFGFGSKLMLSNMTWLVYSESRTFIIGKFYSPAQLAFFTRGYHTCQMPMNIVTTMLSQITYPILSTLQQDRAHLLEIYRKFIRLSSVCIEWGMITMAANSKSFILTLYGENWGQASTYCQLLCISMMLTPLSNINTNLYNVLGRSDISLKKEIILRSYGIPALILGACHSVYGICLSAVSVGVLAFIISIHFTSRICELTKGMQIRDFIPYCLMAFLANIPSIAVNHLMDMPNAAALAIGVTSSLALYILFLYMRKDDAASYLLNHILNKTPLKKIRKRVVKS